MTERQLRESIRLELEERALRHGDPGTVDDVADLFEGLDCDRDTVRSIVVEELRSYGVSH